MASRDPALSESSREELAARKLRELRAKLAGVNAEFDSWLADAGDKKPLRKHRSQIERLTNQLSGMTDAIEGEIDDVSLTDDLVLTECRRLQMRLLEVHRLWDYFRSKLNLRYVRWFRDYLTSADEFAWKCYEPALEAATSEPTAPSSRTVPLVFLSGDFSPYTQGRNTSFEEELEDVPYPLNSQDFVEAAKALPIPVIGVPWYQVAHLPDAVLIAHEVGHDVEDDFGLDLETPVAPVLDAMPSERAFAWRQWLGEVFADLYGVLATGPAFVSALGDLLATDPREVAEQAMSPSPWGSYPPAALRMTLTTYALEELGFVDEAKETRDAWAGAFGAPPDGPHYRDVPGVVDGLLHGAQPNLCGKAPAEILGFSGSDHRAANGVRSKILMPVAPLSDDVRCLMAGARLAFDENPEGYGTLRTANGESPQDLVLKRATEVIGDAPRRAAARTPKPEDDRSAGKALYDRIARATARASPDPRGRDDE